MKKNVTAAFGLVFALVVTPVFAVENFRTHCKGSNEVPPVETRGQCQAVFQLSNDGSELHFQLNVANTNDLVMASHIHLAPEGVNGPVVAFLFSFAPGVESNGYLVDGVLTDADLVGPLTGMTLDDLVSAIEAGGAYVNVHTLSSPGGEVRGQIF